MDNSKNNISDFENLLRKQSFKKPSFLYNKDLNPGEQTYKPQDVIQTVCSQVKAFQLADCVKSVYKDPNDAKKSNYLPLHKLPVYGSRMQEVPTVNTHKFETQCVLDTQLLNIIDGDATTDANTGITQEFDTTFFNTDDKNIQNPNLGKENINDDVKNKMIPVSDVESKYDTRSDQTIEEINVNQNKTEKQTEIDHNAQNDDDSIYINTKQNSQLTKTAIGDTVTFIDNFPVTQEINEEIEGIINNSKVIDMNKTEFSMEIDLETVQDTERIPSPVLKTKAIKRKLKTPPPLVVSLETFEIFENAAMSIIEETDFETAKHLINSQILGNELCLQGDAAHLLGTERDKSPVLDFKSDELQINLNEFRPAKTITTNEIVLLQNAEYVTEKHSVVLQDEILFSSDEEDFVNRQSHNLPLTCALETTNDETDILDKSMFVGFLTASNKSIQISRDSYEHAQSILSNDDGKPVEEFSLTELVEKCGSSYPNPENITNTTVKSIKGCMTKATKLVSVSNDIEDKSRIEQEQKYSKECNENIETCILKINKNTEIVTLKPQSFDGFMTASNKKITMSDRAIARCQKVFKDIDLNDNCETVKVSERKDCTVEIMSYLIEPHNKVGNKINVEDDINKKINDELLLEEFENIEMSLEEKETNSEDKKYVEFEDFRIGNNNKITISNEAMLKTNNLFQNNDKELNEKIKYGENDIEIRKEDRMIKYINTPSTSKAEFVGFKTANNKEIKISEEALIKSKDVFKDIGKDKHKIKTIENLISQPSKGNTSFVGFKTANNKDIKISDAAFCKTKNIFKDIDREKANLNTPIDANQLWTSKTAMFNTENSKGIKNSDAAMSNSKNVGEKSFIQCVVEEPDSAYKGFKTASENQFNISDEAVEKNRNLFSDIIMIDKTRDSNKTTKAGFVGFKTASNKAVNISTDALKKSKKIFSDLDAIDPSDKTPLSSDNNKDKNYMFKGFQTASKKPVTVSEDALTRSKIMFKEIDVVNDTLPENISQSTNVEFLGFQTANENTVDINKEALIASKKLLNDLGHRVGNSKSTFVGFKTASNKNVNVSDEALAKCKNIFDNIEDIPIIQQPAKPESKENIFIGFQTATKNKIEVPKEALKKAKSLFADDFEKQDTGKSFAGFKTANDNKVKISEQALAKSIELFQNMDTKSVINIPKKDNAVPRNNSTDICITKDSFEVNTDTNRVITISEDAHTNSKKLFAEHINNDKQLIATVNRKIDHSTDLEIKKDSLNIDNILDTQVINDFDEDVCSEDFRVIRPNKRSGSPILICPKAKKRKKFETPYKRNQNTVTDFHETLQVTKPNTVTFRQDYKKNKKYTLKDLTDFEKDNRTNIDPYILNFSLENILNFEFDDGRNDFKEGNFTIDDIKQIFIEGTDKKLIPDGWLDIHLKLILWKLISYEIRFPNAIGKVCTVKNVIDQLKYRYDKELYNSERSVLRKIFEKDDVPFKTMVLCVAAVYADGVGVVSTANLNNIELLLTDGWYFIKATIDNMLSKLVYDGKIVVGSKIITCGAELVNCEQGVAPWEDTSSVRLSISGNSTRPARWYEKLGLRPCTMAARLAAVRVGGGKVARLRVRVVKVYPRLYVEKFQDGSTVTRSERLEHQYQMKHEAEREAMIEKIYEEVEKEMSDQESQDSDCTSDPRNKRRCYDSGSQIAKLMKTSRDPMEFRAQLTSSQIHLLQDHVSKQRDRYLQAIHDRVQERLLTRNVVTLARGRVAGFEKDGDRVTVTKGMLSIWKPNDEVLDIFKEGSWIEVTNVFPTAYRNSEIQLSAGRQSVFRPVKCKEDVFKPYLISLSRTCYDLKDLSQTPTMSIDYNEIDTVGVVFSIEPSNRDFDPNKNQFQNVYLADIDKNMIGVNFWGGIKKFGYENVLDTGQVIYCGNLQKRAGNSRKNIPQFRATEFAIFTKTPKNEKGREMVDEMNRKMLGLDRRKFCEDCVAVKQNYSIIRCLNDSENVSPYRFNNSDYNLGRNKVFIETPVGVKVKNKVEEFNLTGLDFESTFKQQDTQLSPKTMERKKKVNEKIAKLKMYGEPPPLSPLNIINKSREATNSYKSPLLRSEETSNNASAASTNKLQGVATPTKLPDGTNIDGGHLVSSPIISNKLLNGTYVKRSINPVKLSFSENVTEENADKIVVEHFADDFDSSPPLSLE